MYPNMYQNRGATPLSDRVESATSVTGCEIVKEILDCLEQSMCYHDNFSRKCHLMGLQGQKRWHRYYCTQKAFDIQRLQHYCIDVYKEDVSPTKLHDSVDFKDTEEYLNAYLNSLHTELNKFNSIYTKCIMNGFIKESEIVQKNICCVTKELEKCNRWIQDFGCAEWDWSYIRVVDSKLHDKMKCKEAEEHGYKD